MYELSREGKLSIEIFLITKKIFEIFIIILFSLGFLKPIRNEF